MNHRYIFLETLEDIRSKTNGSKYQLVKACGLLRLLFLDKTPLVHIINKEFKCKLIFHITDFGRDYRINKGTVLLWERLKPEEFVLLTKKVKLSDFLSTICLHCLGESYTVKDIILVSSHILGGVHAGEAENVKDERLLEFFSIEQDKEIKQQLLEQFEHVIVGDELGFDSIKDICLICLDALKELEDKVKV